MTNRIAVSVDLISLFSSVKALYDGNKINYEKYLDKIELSGDIYRAYAYGAYIDTEADGFINCLKQIGFETKYVEAVFFDKKQNIKKTDRTIDMIVDLFKIIDRIDTVVIGTLNTNIIPFINFLKDRGIKVILFSCNCKKELRAVCDEYWSIDEKILEFEIEKNDSRNPQVQGSI